MSKRQIRYFVNNHGAPIGTPAAIAPTLKRARQIAKTCAEANIVKSANGATWTVEIYKAGTVVWSEVKK